MVERFVSTPIELSAAIAAGEFERADLVFYGVDHSGDSYEGRVYVNNPDADAATGRDAPSYVGSFHVFGHGGCFGDEGHCDVPSDPHAPFDLRPPHQLTPHVKAVIVTDALKRVLTQGPIGHSITVTVAAVVVGPGSNETLAFDELRLLSYR
jgi:tyrosinase